MRNSILAAALALVLGGAAAPVRAGQPSPQAIVKQMEARLRQAFPGKTLQRDPADPYKIVVVNPSGQGDQTIYLDRIVNYCGQASRADCSAAQQRFVAVMTKPLPTFSAASLRVVLRDRQYADAVRAMGPDKDGRASAFIRQVGEDLFLLLALDGKDQIAMAGAKDLAQFGIDEREAWKLAMIQTQSILPALPTAAQLRKNATGFEAREYLGSMLGDLDAWSAIATDAGPDLIVTVVSDQFVLVGLMPDGPGLDKFAATVADDCRAQERCISPHVYRFRGGRWVIAR